MCKSPESLIDGDIGFELRRGDSPHMTQHIQTVQTPRAETRKQQDESDEAVVSGAENFEEIVRIFVIVARIRSSDHRGRL